MRRAHAETVGVGQTEQGVLPWPGRSGATNRVSGTELGFESSEMRGLKSWAVQAHP